MCSPRSSIPRTHRDVTATRVAIRNTRGYSSSRISAVCCLESFSADSARRSDNDSRS